MAMSDHAKTASEESYELTTAFVWTERAFDVHETGKLQAEIQQRRAACAGPTCGASVRAAGTASMTGSRSPR